jgi:hypothetical protein
MPNGTRCMEAKEITGCCTLQLGIPKTTNVLSKGVDIVDI